MLDELPVKLLAGEVLFGGVRLSTGEVLLVGLLLSGGVRVLPEELLLVGILFGFRLAGYIGLLTGEVLLAGDAGDKEEVLLLAELAELTGYSMGTSSSIIFSGNNLLTFKLFTQITH